MYLYMGYHHKEILQMLPNLVHVYVLHVLLFFLFVACTTLICLDNIQMYTHIWTVRMTQTFEFVFLCYACIWMVWYVSKYPHLEIIICYVHMCDIFKLLKLTCNILLFNWFYYTYFILNLVIFIVHHFYSQVTVCKFNVCDWPFNLCTVSMALTLW